MIIRTRAPTRISFGGGGTDLSPYCDIYGGTVLSATINKYVYVTLLPKKTGEIRILSADYKRTFSFDSLGDVKFNGDIDLIKAAILRMQPAYGFDLYLRSDIPPNTGLGSSGAVASALIGAFNHLRNRDKLNRYEIAELAYQVESDDLDNIGGRQDQYAATFGGFNFLEFKGQDFVRISPVSISEDYILELEKHLILAFVGPRGPSGEVQSAMIEEQIKHKSRTTADPKTAILHQLKKMCRDMYIALTSGHLDLFGHLLDRAWVIKRELSPQISTAKNDEVYQIAKSAGALGGKITGAGGGGCMIFFCASNKEQDVAEALQNNGVQVIDFSFDSDGLTSWQLSSKHRRELTLQSNQPRRHKPITISQHQTRDPA